ncbi:nitroreductase family protein [Candidatus Woesearchaeota archaeon]|nr:nitroreductase family protein [Candidatus Woesearchaeota archaeon]
MPKIIDTIRTRKSVRQYQKSKLSMRLIEQLINSGRCAPVSMDDHHPFFFAVEHREILDKISDYSKKTILADLEKGKSQHYKMYTKILMNPNFDIFYNAPQVIFIFGDSRNPHFVQECSFSAMNIMLAAHEKNIGTCMVGFLNEGFMRFLNKRIIMPQTYKFTVALSVGYPKGKNKSDKRRKKLYQYLSRDEIPD